MENINNLFFAYFVIFSQNRGCFQRQPKHFTCCILSEKENPFHSSKIILFSITTHVYLDQSIYLEIINFLLKTPNDAQTCNVHEQRSIIIFLSLKNKRRYYQLYPFLLKKFARVDI